MVFGLYASLAQTTGINWDVLNYHLYVADAFWRSRIDNDLLAAGIMSYLPPLIDVPYYYFTVVCENVRLGDFVLAFWGGLNCFLLFFIARKVVPAELVKDYPFLCVCLAVLGTVCPVGIIEITNPSFGDVLVEPFVLGTLLCGLYFKGASYGRVFLLGSLAGICGAIAVALKLTNVFYVALVPFIILVCPSQGRGKYRLFFCLAYSAAFLPVIYAIVGWWYLKIHAMFGSPLFPLYTKYFPSSIIDAMGGQFSAFGPRNLIQVLFWTYFIARGRSYHIELGDWVGLHPHIWAVLFTLLLIILVISVTERVLAWNKRTELNFFGPGAVAQWRVVNALKQKYVPLTAGGGFLLLWVGLGFACWEVMFSLYRYAAPLDAVAPILLFVVFGTFGNIARSRFGVYLVFAAVFATSLSMWLTMHGGRFEIVGKDTPLFGVEHPILSDPAHTTIILYRPTMSKHNGYTFSWVTTQFPKEVGFTQISEKENNIDTKWINLPFKPAYDGFQHDYIRNRNTRHLYAFIGVEDFRWHPQMSLPTEVKRAERELSRHGYVFSGRCTDYKLHYGLEEGEYAFCPLKIVDKEAGK